MLADTRLVGSRKRSTDRQKRKQRKAREGRASRAKLYIGVSRKEVRRGNWEEERGQEGGIGVVGKRNALLGGE